MELFYTQAGWKGQKPRLTSGNAVERQPPEGGDGEFIQERRGDL